MKMIFAAKFSLLLFAGTLCLAVSAQTINVSTAETALTLNQNWAKAYGAKQADAKFEITGGTVSNAFGALAEKKSQLASVPRSMRFKEAQACEAALGAKPTEFKLAVNAVAVFVNAANPVKELTYDELAAVFQGQRRNWKKLGGNDAPVIALGVATNTSHGELFVEEVLAGKGMTNDVRIVAAAELLKNIAKDPNAIGFGPLAAAEGVRLVEIKRAFSSTPVTPSEETISNRIYPIARFIYAYTDTSAPKPEVKAYLDWIRSDEGQRVAKDAGYFPIAAKWRNTP